MVLHLHVAVECSSTPFVAKLAVTNRFLDNLSCGIPRSFEPILLCKLMYQSGSIVLSKRYNFDKVLAAFILSWAVISVDNIILYFLRGLLE